MKKYFIGLLAMAASMQLSAEYLFDTYAIRTS